MASLTALAGAALPTEPLPPWMATHHTVKPFPQGYGECIDASFKGPVPTKVIPGILVTATDLDGKHEWGPFFKQDNIDDVRALCDLLASIGVPVEIVAVAKTVPVTELLAGNITVNRGYQP